MVTVDSKGRIVLPQEIRNRLGIRTGVEVEVRADDGRIVIEPEEDPDRIIEDLERRITEASSGRRRPTDATLDVESRRHVESIQRQAGSAGSE